MHGRRQPVIPDWENPAVYNINQRSAHVPLRSFVSTQAALQHIANAQAVQHGDRITSLNSLEWAFKLLDSPEEVPEDFSSPTFDTTAWSRVRITILL